MDIKVYQLNKGNSDEIEIRIKTKLSGVKLALFSQVFDRMIKENAENVKECQKND